MGELKHYTITTHIESHPWLDIQLRTTCSSRLERGALICHVSPTSSLFSFQLICGQLRWHVQADFVSSERRSQVCCPIGLFAEGYPSLFAPSSAYALDRLSQDVFGLCFSFIQGRWISSHQLACRPSRPSLKCSPSLDRWKPFCHWLACFSAFPSLTASCSSRGFAYVSAQLFTVSPRFGPR